MIQYILRDAPRRTVLVTGLASAIIQVVLLREALSVFSGNELVLGIVLAVWLFASGMGSVVGTRLRARHELLYGLALPLSAALSFVALRFSCTFFEPGTQIGPLAIVSMSVCVESVPAFLGGYVFGELSAAVGGRSSLYASENAGAVAGSLLVFAATVSALSNVAMLAACIIVLGVLLLKKPVLIIVPVLCVAALLGTERYTAAWKYASEPSRIRYAREGELAVISSGGDTAVFLNNSLYRTSLDEPMIEQAVHIPLAQRPWAQRVLVLFDRGHSRELAKYDELRVHVVETDPLLASQKAIVTAPELLEPTVRYDVILMGTGIARTAASNRFYTKSFFEHMERLLATNGVLSFTLAFSENYLSAQERELYDVIRVTLMSVFDEVRVFPGNGYTFMASQAPLSMQPVITAPTQYLEPYVLAAVQPSRIDMANAEPSVLRINTTQRPIALLLALRRWMQLWGMSSRVLVALLVIAFIGAVLLLPKTSGVLSVSTSGLATGVYSVALMLLFQSTYGSLYSGVALLLAALTIGFVLGSTIRILPASDLLLGIHALATLVLLSVFPRPPVSAFFAAHLGIGFLSAAQFVTRKDAQLGMINAADLFGGVFGMALASTVLVPLFGIIPLAVGICMMKTIVWIAGFIQGGDQEAARAVQRKAANFQNCTGD